MGLYAGHSSTKHKNAIPSATRTATRKFYIDRHRCYTSPRNAVLGFTPAGSAQAGLPGRCLRRHPLPRSRDVSNWSSKSNQPPCLPNVREHLPGQIFGDWPYVACVACHRTIAAPEIAQRDVVLQDKNGVTAYRIEV